MRIFGRSPEKSTSGESLGIRIHEDDWGMRNLYPVQAFVEVQGDLDQSIQASIDNRADNGIGWTAVHLIEHPANDYAAVGLELRAASLALEALLPRVTNFTATAMSGFGDKKDPLGSYETDAYCFGFDASCFIKLDPIDDVVKAAWFECRTADAAKLSGLRSGLLAINQLVPSVVADYWLHVGGLIGDAEFLQAYLEQLRESAMP